MMPIMSGVVWTFGAAAGVIVGLVLLALNNRDWFALRRAQRKFARLIRERGLDVRISSYGITHLSARYPDVWIVTATDSERDELQRDSNLVIEMQGALTDEGYPQQDVQHVQFVFESEQTVKRDFSGDWSRRRYVWYRKDD